MNQEDVVEDIQQGGGGGGGGDGGGGGEVDGIHVECRRLNDEVSGLANWSDGPPRHAVTLTVSKLSLLHTMLQGGLAAQRRLARLVLSTREGACKGWHSPHEA
jgi:hypothetical protein